jgi:hypothetical protein
MLFGIYHQLVSLLDISRYPPGRRFDSCRAHLLEHSSLFSPLNLTQNGTVQVMGLYLRG